MRRRRLILPLLLPLLAGCDPSIWNANKQPTTRPAGTMAPDAMRQKPSVAMEGTIGSVAYLQGARMMRVRGYGLVVGLGNKGSRTVRSSVREEILKELRRYKLENPHTTGEWPTAEQQMDSLDSTVVEVTADIPAGMIKDQYFDVTVRAEDEETQSLVGGTLVPCNLRIFQEVSPGDVRSGRILARAGGPIFMNPFITPTAATSQPTTRSSAPNLREGYIIGGGKNLENRRLSLVAIVESYATVRAIQEAINRRFQATPKPADAVNPTTVELHIPPEFYTERQRFIELVMHLPLASSPIQREARTKALIAEMGRVDAPLDDVGLSLEGIGHSILPALSPLYTDARRSVSYFSARTGMRMGDELAVEVVARHATDSKSPYRLPAIRELGYCRNRGRASQVLRGLLSESDTRIRIRAYEALRKVDPESMSRFVVGQRPQNYMLEVVPSDGPPLIFARRSESRRIAMIGGEKMLFRPPVLYAQPGQPVTLSAPESSRSLTLIRKNLGGKNIGPLEVPMAVVPLVKFLGNDMRLGPEQRLEGLGLDYAVVLDVLYRLCEQGAINADLRWEEPSVEDLVGPLRPMGRPESEL